MLFSTPGFRGTVDIRGVESNVNRTPAGVIKGGAKGKKAAAAGGENSGNGYQPKARRRMVFKMGARQHIPL